MKLLLFACLSLCVYAIYIPNGSSKHPKEVNNASKKLFQNSKVDPEERRERLEKLGKKLVEELRENQPADVKEHLEKIRPIQTVKSDLKDESLFEINRRVGVAPYLFHGDIHLSEEQLSLMENSISGSNRVKRQMPTFANRWTNNTLYFYFDAEINIINERKKTSIRAAHAYLQDHTCISFVESETADNRVKVIDGRGCYSEVGMVGGEQHLSIEDGCESMGTTAHEFIHALGSYHTQERSDRDDYVTINTYAIEGFSLDNFSKLPSGGDYIYTPYDYASVMHYAANGAAIGDNLPIIPKDANYIHTMGNGQLSFYDIEMLNAYYGCDALCPVDTSAKCKNGGLPNPRNCSVCNCPSGYGGDLCDQRPSGCGETVTATENWKNLEFNFGDSQDNETIRDEFTLCNHWIEAPSGKQIEVKIIHNFNGQCNYGCTLNGIELKTSADSKIVNPLICCEEFNNQIFKSFLNPMPIVSFNRYYYSNYIIQYRFVEGSVQPITKVVSTTVKPKQTTTTTIAPKECKDTGSFYICYVLQKTGSCSSKVALTYCAKTCGSCTP